MKLASIKNGTRDGQLVVVSQDLSYAVLVPNIAATMQEALDHWEHAHLKLKQVYQDLNNSKITTAFAFDEQQAMSPLPRAYQWADGSAYVNHVELVRKARGAEMPENFWTDPLLYQGGSDKFLHPREDIVVNNIEYGVDFEAEIAVITNDVPMNCDIITATNAITLIMLVNDVSLRNLIPNEIGKGFGFFQSKPASSFSPVAVTPDELGDAWLDGRVHLPLISTLNNKLFGKPNAGVDMTFNFPKLITHAAKTRCLAAGTIIGSGTVSNTDRSAGSSCIAEKRMLETIADGKPSTPFMQPDDIIRIEMVDKNNNSIFGAIQQKLVVCSNISAS
jgi:fumarylacetoacetate (FAA) hydrolase